MTTGEVEGGAGAGAAETRATSKLMITAVPFMMRELVEVVGFWDILERIN
jgi:hypothetical protein